MPFPMGPSAIKAEQQPADLKFLLTDAGRSLLAELDLELLPLDGEPPGVFEEFERKPRADDDVANLEALREVLGYATWIVEAVEDNGTLYGYWHGPDAEPATEAAIVTYDSEGTLDTACGNSLIEALVLKACYENEGRFAALKQRLSDHGVTLKATTWETYSSRPCKTNPQKLHNEIYERNQAKASAGS